MVVWWTPTDGRMAPTRRGWPVRRTGALGCRGLQSMDGWSGEWADGRTRRSRAEQARTGEQGGRSGFKRCALLHPISLSRAQSTYLMKEQVCTVHGSAMGSMRTSTLRHPYYPKRAQTHLPCLCASVRDPQNDILFSGYKNGFNRWRWQRNAKSEVSNPCSKEQGWREGQKKVQGGGLRTQNFPQSIATCIPGMGAVASIMVSSHSHEVCQVPPLRPPVATSSHEQHCKSKDAKYLYLEDVEVKWWFMTILWAISEQTK